MWKVGFRVAPSSSHRSGSISTLGSTRGAYVGHPHIPINVSIITPWKNQLLLGALELNAFNHLWTYQVCYVFPPVLAFLALFLAKHVTGKFRLLILVAPCCMEIPWFPQFLNMFEGIPHQCPFIKNLVMHLLVDQCSRVCQSLPLTFWLLKRVCSKTRVPFLSLSDGGGSNSTI